MTYVTLCKYIAMLNNYEIKKKYFIYFLIKFYCYFMLGFFGSGEAVFKNSLG